MMGLLFASSTPVGGKPSIDPFEHVVDSNHLGIFETAGWEYHLPSPFSKSLIFLVLAAIFVATALCWVAHKIKSGETPKGKLWNFLEAIIFFVRDKIAIPGIGEHDAPKYLPFLTTLFLFILTCNLMGMLPFCPTATAHIYVTGALAMIVFFVIHVSGIKEHGVTGYLKTFIPHIEIEGGAKVLAPVFIIGIALLEYATAFIRAIVLAIRLFANMLAGHTVLYMLLFFIKLVADPNFKIAIAENWMFYPVSVFSIVMVTSLSLLELFIAALQAFIFTFLSAIFIGLAKHPAH